MPENYDQFTERARKALSLAFEEARQLNHSYIGTEHLLLGLVREGDGVAAKVLSNMGVHLPGVRSAVDSIIGQGSETATGERDLTPRTRQVIEYAVDEARRLHHHYVGTEHLLLGLLRDHEGIAAGILASLGVDSERTRRDVLDTISASSHPYWRLGEVGVIPGLKPAPYSQAAQRVLSVAHQEARQFHHAHIDSEHVLLGLLAEETGIAANVLRDLGVGYSQARQIIQSIARHKESTQPDVLGFSPRGRVVVDLAVHEARRLHHDEVGTEHLLLGVTRDGGGLAGGVFRQLDIDPEDVRRRVFEAMGATEPPEAQGTFTKFTERARKVMSLAQEEARRFNHSYIGTEHLLLGLVREGDGVAANALNNMGVQLPRVRSAVEHIVGRGETMVVGEIGLTPRARKVIELAVDEARRLNHHYIGTEHLLLGLIREGEGIAAGVLASLGVSLERARGQVLQVISESSNWPPGNRTHATSMSYGLERDRYRLPYFERLLASVGILSNRSGLNPHDISVEILGAIALPDRDVLIFRECAGISAVDIAHLLNLSVPEVDMALERAKAGFRRAIWRSRDCTSQWTASRKSL